MKQFELNKFLPLEVDDNILENNSVLFIAPWEKDFEKIHCMKNKLFIFNFIEDILFFLSCRETNYFLKKIPAPPEYQMVRR